MVRIKRLFGADFILRARTGLIGAPLILLITYLGGPLFQLGTGVVGVLGGLELAHMIHPAHRWLAALVTGGIIVTIITLWLGLLPLALLLLLVFALAGALETRQQRGVSLRHYAYALGGTLYIGLSMGVLGLIRAGAEGAAWTLMLLISNWCTDTFAMLGGRLWGQRKLVPSISPGKTVEGAAVGLTAGFIGGMVVALLTGLPLPIAVVANLIIPLATETGDLIESLLKRRLHVKDSGSLLPGHGGMLDRIDGTLLAAPSLFTVLLLLAG